MYDRSMHEAEEQVGGGDAGEFDHLLPAVEAAALLGVKLPTLYSYASRGVVTSVRRPDRRGSWFDPAELDQVARRGRTGSATRLSDMQFQSSVTLVDQGRFFYRGQDPARLAVSASFEEVADLLWGGDAAGWCAAPPGPGRPGPPNASSRSGRSGGRPGEWPSTATGS